MASLKVEITEVKIISPAIPTEKHQLPATTFDLMQKRDAMPYLQRIAFYDSAGDQEELVRDLRSSLSQVLVPFYPIAGRVCFPRGKRPAIDCNDSGVEFSVAVADASLSDLDLSRYSPVLQQLIQRGNYEESTMSGTAPFLAIQVTKFKCGGVSIAWSFDHLLADGIAMMNFLIAWSETCRGETISQTPSHDRWFEQRNPKLVPEGVDNVAAGEFRYNFIDHSTHLVGRIFSFDEEEVQKLKSKLAEADENSLGPFTTYEAVAAHFWVTLTRVRKLSDTQRTRAQIAVNCRHKLDPPLPMEYFGNAVLPGVAESTAGELDTGGSFAAALLLKRAIKSFGLDDIQSQFETYNENYLGQNPMAQGLNDGFDIFFGSSLRHPLYEIDFGWERAAAVRHGRMLWDGFCFLDPSPKGGRSMEITIHLPPLIMDAFATAVRP